MYTCIYLDNVMQLGIIKNPSVIN